MADFSEILGDVSKEKFRQTMNRLLNECFILKKNSTTASDYRFIVANQSLFEGVLDLLGYELIVREDQGVITIYNPAGTGRIRFSRLESILLLILRLLYIEKMREVSQAQEAIVLLEEILEKYGMLKLGRLRKDLLLNALRGFKRLNLIANLDRMDTGDPGIRIQIYPSILFAVTSVSLEEAYQLAQEKLAQYAGGEESIDADDESEKETDEDPAD
ncbi:MAG: DUF4194 domain-containing protein [Lachnospiraceae bacterium]|nr:DUF4194 domain-containing protein [Lachnospiraceae bacterium]